MRCSQSHYATLDSEYMFRGRFPGVASSGAIPIRYAPWFRSVGQGYSFRNLAVLVVVRAGVRTPEEQGKSGKKKYGFLVGVFIVSTTHNGVAVSSSFRLAEAPHSSCRLCCFYGKGVVWWQPITLRDRTEFRIYSVNFRCRISGIPILLLPRGSVVVKATALCYTLVRAVRVCCRWADALRWCKCAGDAGSYVCSPGQLMGDC
jgi:hypothetical protein